MLNRSAVNQNGDIPSFGHLEIGVLDTKTEKRGRHILGKTAHGGTLTSKSSERAFLHTLNGFYKSIRLHLLRAFRLHPTLANGRVSITYGSLPPRCSSRLLC